MYSKKVQAFLKSRKIRIGDRISLKRSGANYEGLLMPQTRLGDPNVIVLKLDTGYNAGLAFSGSKMAKLKSKTHRLGSTGGKKMKFSKNKPKVSIISIGGTISSRVDYKTGGVTTIKHPEEFLDTIPELAKFVNIYKCHTPFAKMSEDMDHKDFQNLAKEINAELAHKNVRGVIVTMGTDCLHYASAAISFMLQTPGKPVIFTAAQRSSDRGSSDSAMNLVCAAYAAISDIAEVGVVMHASESDNYCLFIPGTKVRKMHASRRDAFRPINSLPIALVYPDGKIKKVSSYQKRGSGRPKLNTKYEPKVALVKVYPSSDPSVLDFYLEKGYKGFVIEGTGLGHVPTNGSYSWIPAIKKISAKFPVVIASQTIYGRVNPNVYTNLRILFKETNAIPSEDMHPETAFIKLSWVLGQTKDLKKVRQMMLTNYTGEITKRSEPEGYLY